MKVGLEKERRALEKMSGTWRRLVQPAPSEPTLPAPPAAAATAGKAPEPAEQGKGPR